METHRKDTAQLGQFSVTEHMVIFWFMHFTGCRETKVLEYFVRVWFASNTRSIRTMKNVSAVENKRYTSIGVTLDFRYSTDRVTKYQRSEDFFPGNSVVPVGSGAP